MVLFLFHKIQSFAPRYSSVLTRENPKVFAGRGEGSPTLIGVIGIVKETVVTTDADQVEHAGYCLELA